MELHVAEACRSRWIRPEGQTATRDLCGTHARHEASQAGWSIVGHVAQHLASPAPSGIVRAHCSVYAHIQPQRGPPPCPPVSAVDGLPPNALSSHCIPNPCAQVAGSLLQFAALSWVASQGLAGAASSWAVLKLMTGVRCIGGYLVHFVSPWSAYRPAAE